MNCLCVTSYNALFYFLLYLVFVICFDLHCKLESCVNQNNKEKCIYAIQDNLQCDETL